ncbi:MAG: hypothetical protein NTV60_02600 [Candidatus Kaiserbacteria bacterium]|nr:hypothetical protein [Candidatus Kaiserbacteria bacterium]
MPKIKDIYFANTAEAFASLLESETSDKDAQQERIKHETDLSQRAQFWGEDDKVIVTPEPIPAALLESNSKRLGYNNLINLWPKESKLRLCVTVANDTVLKDKIIEIIRINPDIRISSYAATEEYVDLIKMLQKEDIHFEVTNLPHIANPIHLVQKIGSKNGIREIISDLFPKGRIRLPVGYICKNKDEILKAISEFLNTNREFVIKIHNGESGWGVKIMNEKAVQSLDRIHMDTWLEDLFQSDQIWKSAPYVVEKFIQADTTMAGGFPSGEGYVNDRGFTFSYSCGQEVTSQGEFGGITIGKSSMSHLFNEGIETALNIVGDKLHSIGYRGNFDIDFVAGADGNLYILECNARMTGGTHVHGVISHLKINTELESYIFSNDSYRYEGKAQPPEKVLRSLSHLLYPMHEEERGVLISFMSSSRPVIGIIVVGKDSDDTRSLTGQVKSSLEAL